VWRCEGGHDTCVGSVAELSELAGRDLSELDLHRPAVDDVELRCPTEGCDQPARRLPPVLDAWFDSGSMPSAQHHFPFENSELFAAGFPADFICEAIDQTRGWFYTLLAVNTLALGSTPYTAVVCLGLLVDGEGQKMSKTRGNVVDPWHIFETFGADALRWNFFSVGQPWGTRRVSLDGIRESTSSLVTLWNVFSFFCTYADLEGWSPPEGEPPPPTHVLDRWVLGQLDETVAEVTAALEGFDALRAASRIERFVDDLSNWYVRRSRPRFWKASDPAAFATLHRCLVVVAELLAPFCPFLGDELWTTLTGGRSVHLTDWPEPAGTADAGLTAEVAAARQLVALGREARTDAKVKVRQPLRRALLLHPGADLSEEVRAEVADELNVHALQEIESLGGLVRWTVVPNFRALGPRLGPRVREVKAALATADGSQLAAQLETEGAVVVAGERLGPEDVEVRAERSPDVALAREGSWAVALDLDLDDGLVREGTARELVRALNDHRKELGLAIADRVRLTLAPRGPRVRAAVDAHGDDVAAEVLAVERSVVAEPPGGAATIEVDGEAVAVLLERVERPG
jgi:isoleucyl-tRNA synthetase